MYKYLLWDIDGTVLDFLSSEAYAIRALFKKYNLGECSDEMLKFLGRSHSCADTVKAVERARKAGFSNISLDLMIGLPDSNLSTLERDIDFILSLSPSHISAYILKIEPDTAFGKRATALGLLDDDAIAEQYLYMCEKLKAQGFSHYEISNFAKTGLEGKHNMKY